MWNTKVGRNEYIYKKNGRELNSSYLLKSACIHHIFCDKTIIDIPYFDSKNCSKPIMHWFPKL
ncbi:hypothetical protein KFK09_022770 [Dendrobium nobile]|uniref:Uncharacterized protein n=1 Tax=Dendrobium nobile TaxID=94219 RepID=A0A8T3AJQ1_DENNO|nr:hypothetical protein KFK09_022770 [Dendrobium nobile]